MRSQAERKVGDVMVTKLRDARGMDSLYAQLGGKRAIVSVVQKFYERVLADPSLRALFAKADMASIKQRQVLFLTQAVGGPTDPKNRDLKPAHAHLLRELRH